MREDDAPKAVQHKEATIVIAVTDQKPLDERATNLITEPGDEVLVDTKESRFTCRQVTQLFIKCLTVWNLAKILQISDKSYQFKHDKQGKINKSKISFDYSAHKNNSEKKKKKKKSTKATDESDGQNVDKDVDSGYAWIILFVMFVINANTFGTARAYTLIFERTARQHEQSRAGAALPFTIMGAVENMGGPLTGYLLGRTKSWRIIVFMGSCLISLSHLIAAFLTHSQVGQILTMGLMCGIGLSFVTISSFQINNSYFVRYRSRAFGFGLTGAVIGTLYISPICQYALNTYTTNVCYLTLSAILSLNIPLSLLLKPKPTTNSNNTNSAIKEKPLSHHTTTYSNPPAVDTKNTNAPIVVVDPPPTTVTTTRTTETRIYHTQVNNGAVYSSSITMDNTNNNEHEKEKTPPVDSSLWRNILIILSNPMFHLIWLTQLLFCWYNFVYGMIIVDFGEDQGLDREYVSHLIPVWALGQLAGRMVLGYLVDLRFLSYKSFTVICFSSISAATWCLNNYNNFPSLMYKLNLNENEFVLIAILVFILSMFISNLYLLFNGIVLEYTKDKSLTGLSIGISSFTGSFFLLPRAYIIGYYRDTFGNYNGMLEMFTYTALVAALVWLFVPYIVKKLQNKCKNAKKQSLVENLICH